MAATDKTKTRASDAIMPPDRMKPLLALSKKEPVNAAIGLSSDGDAVILLDKKASPRRVASMLRAKAAKQKIQLNTGSLRFGRAEVDTDYDPGTVRFFINKDAPGSMRMKLLEVIKRVPFAQVEINVDPSIELVVEEDAAEDAEAGPEEAVSEQAATAFDPRALGQMLATLMKRLAEVPASSPSRAALIQIATDANARLKAAELPQADALITQLQQALDDAAAPSAASLRAELESLIRSIGDASVLDPARRVALIKLAGELNAALKANDLATVAAGLPHLRAGVDPHPIAAGPKKPDPKVAFAQARLRYDAGRKQIASEVAKLMAAMKSAFAGEPDFAAISGAVDTFAGLRDVLDDRLMNELDRGYNASGDDERNTARQAAQGVLEEYRHFLGDHAALLSGIDSNPFVPVSVEGVLPPLLAELAEHLK